LIEKELKENEKFEDQLKVGVDDILMVISEETEFFSISMPYLLNPAP